MRMSTLKKTRPQLAESFERLSALATERPYLDLTQPDGRTNTWHIAKLANRNISANAGPLLFRCQRSPLQPGDVIGCSSLVERISCNSLMVAEPVLSNWL